MMNRITFMAVVYFENKTVNDQFASAADCIAFLNDKYPELMAGGCALGINAGMSIQVIKEK